jgi:hypothetical protein
MSSHEVKWDGARRQAGRVTCQLKSDHTTLARTHLYAAMAPQATIRAYGLTCASTKSRISPPTGPRRQSELSSNRLHVYVDLDLRAGVGSTHHCRNTNPRDRLSLAAPQSPCPCS